MEVFIIVSFIFSIIALVVSLITISMLIGWKNSTHKVYTKFVQSDGKPVDIAKQLDDYFKDIDSDEL